MTKEKNYNLLGSKLVDGGVVGCLGNTSPGEAKSPGPTGLSPFDM